MSALETLLADISGCRACASEFPHVPRPVVRVGPGTEILLCGQAPGRKVHESGLPFDDASGDRLRAWMGIDRETFYGDPRVGVAAMSFCYPGVDPGGGDRPPPRRCAELWRSRLLSQLPRVRLTLLIGGHAQRWALGGAGPMTATVRDWRRHAPEILVLPHPSWRNTAWLRRNPWFEEEVAPYLRQRVAELLG